MAFNLDFLHRCNYIRQQYYMGMIYLFVVLFSGYNLMLVTLNHQLDCDSLQGFGKAQFLFTIYIIAIWFIDLMAFSVYINTLWFQCYSYNVC